MDRLTAMTAFVRVVERGGSAAADLHLSRARVGKHVQDLEAHLRARKCRLVARLKDEHHDPAQAVVDGLRFDNRYYWIVHFDGGTIDRLRAYLDSAMVARLFKENSIQH
jgi:hypothetical protein